MRTGFVAGGNGEPAIDIVDETLVVAPPHKVREVLCDERWWEVVVPGVRMTCIDDRGRLGKRWAVAGTLRGSAEVWLEPWTDAVIVHVFLQADPHDGRAVHARTHRSLELAIKRHVLTRKDALEAGRAPGMPREAAQGE